MLEEIVTAITPDAISSASKFTPMETFAYMISGLDSKTLLILIIVFILISIGIWLIFKFLGGLLYKKIEKWLTDRKIKLSGGKISIPGVGEVGFESSDKKKIEDYNDDIEEKEEQLREITNRKGDISIFAGIFEDRTRKIIEKQNKKIETLMRHYESLEEQISLKISDDISDWLSLKLHISKDKVYDDDSYYYLVSTFENILNKIKIEWRNSFSKNGFEDVAEENEYVTEKTAIIKSICKNHIQYNFKSSKLLKSELFIFIDDLENEFRNMNINLFQRARKESRLTELVTKSWDSEIKENRDNLLLGSHIGGE